jgi:hypothetical protein
MRNDVQLGQVRGCHCEPPRQARINAGGRYEEHLSRLGVAGSADMLCRRHGATGFMAPGTVVRGPRSGPLTSEPGAGRLSRGHPHCVTLRDPAHTEH